jgi:hypothetical protein
VLGAAERGLTVLPVVAYSTPWVGPIFQIPTHPTAFAAFTAQVAERYGPGGTLWRTHPAVRALPATWLEIWNEPYSLTYDSSGDAGAYARLYKAAVIAGRAANPRTRYLIEMNTVHQTSDGAQPWIGALFRAVPDLGEYIDAVAVHPYSTSRVFDPAHFIPGPEAQYQSGRVAQIHSQLLSLGVDKPVWITEIGWSTCRSAATAICVSDAVQAEYLQQIFELVASTWTYVAAVLPYELQDGPGPRADPLLARPRNDPQRHYGLLRANGSRKPAWYVFRAEATALGEHLSLDQGAALS